jgi:hypothetical protein
MQDKELYQRIPGLERPWSVSDVELDVQDGRVDIRAEREPGVSWPCPECGDSLGCYDHAEERLLHASLQPTNPPMKRADFYNHERPRQSPEAGSGGGGAAWLSRGAGSLVRRNRSRPRRRYAG